MKRTKYILIQIFISPEFVSSLFIILIYLINTNPFLWLADKIIANELLMYVPFAPLGLLSFSVANMRKILSPNVASKKIFFRWELYQEVKDTTYIGIFYLLIALVMSAIPIIVDAQNFTAMTGLLLVASYLISLSSSGTMLFASHKVEEILEIHT